MADKIFTDNDLLEEKSYDTKIMEGAGVEPDATYLEQVPVKKRLAEAVEAGGGSSSGVTEYLNIVKVVAEGDNLKITECPQNTTDGMNLLLLIDYGETGKFANNAMYDGSGYIVMDTYNGVTGSNTIGYYHTEFMLSNGFRVGSYLTEVEANSFNYDITFTKE